MDELNDLNRKLDSLDLTDFERESLIPMILDRMTYYLDTFTRMIPICENRENALLIDAAVRKVVAHPGIDPDTPTPQAGAQYLAELQKSLREYWIQELADFRKLYPDPSSIRTGKELFRLCQKTQELAGSIVWCKTRLLSFSLRCFPLVIDTATGQTKSGPPEDIEIIILPIKGLLSEIESSATSLIETLRVWSQSKRDTRKEYITYLSALEQTRSAKSLNKFQILVIIFTVVLTLASGRLVALTRDTLHWLLPCIF